MTMQVSVEQVAPRVLAAVRRSVRIGEVARAFGPPLDAVWTFLRARPGLRTDGHNVFLYQHPKDGRGSPMEVAFGVEVTREFEGAGEVVCTATPSGEVATARHRGAYDQLRATHDAIHQWARGNRRVIGAQSWEIYGDWTDDPTRLEMQVCYLLMG